MTIRMGLVKDPALPPPPVPPPEDMGIVAPELPPPQATKPASEALAVRDD